MTIGNIVERLAKRGGMNEPRRTQGPIHGILAGGLLYQPNE